MNADADGNTDAKMSMPRFPNGLPLSQIKHLEVKKIILKEGNKKITNDDQLCEVFNKYFPNVEASLNTPNVNNVNIISTQN